MSKLPDSPPPANRSQWTNLIVLTAAVLMVFVVFHFRPFGDPNPGAHAAVGKPMLVMSLQPLTGKGKPVDREDLNGSVVLVNFWATSYTPCREELPSLAAIADHFQDRKHFKLLAISCDEVGQQDQDTLRRRTAKVLKELKLDLPTYADTDGVTEAGFRAVAELSSGPAGASEGAPPAAAKLLSYPTTYLVDRAGTIRYVWEGYRPGIEKEQERLVAKLLDEPE